MKQSKSSRERVLELLESHPGTYLSGETIARQLGLSRNAVWKAVNTLRKSGYGIEAVTNRGYCLTGPKDVLSGREILEALNADCSSRGLSFSGEKIFFYDELPSTNLTAKEKALAGAPHGTVLIAGKQSAGAAKRAGRFESPEGGLYLSVIIRPAELSGERALPGGTMQGYIRFSAAAVCLAIEEVCDVRPVIREMNDLYLDERKICGILTESGSEIESGMIHWIVIGIGIHFREFYRGDLPGARSRLAAAIIRNLLCGRYTVKELEQAYQARHTD